MRFIYNYFYYYFLFLDEISEAKRQIPASMPISMPIEDVGIRDVKSYRNAGTHRRRKTVQINLSNKFACTSVISQERRSIRVFLRATILRRRAKPLRESRGAVGRGNENIKRDGGTVCSRGQGRDYNSECNVCIFDVYDLSNPTRGPFFRAVPSLSFLSFFSSTFRRKLVCSLSISVVSRF